LAAATDAMLLLHPISTDIRLTLVTMEKDTIRADNKLLWKKMITELDSELSDWA
jgi:hypothetical protein